MATTYIARLNGASVGTITIPDYTHAIIVQYDEDYARNRARTPDEVSHLHNQIAEGYFHPKVVAWCIGPEAAEKEASSKRNWKRVKCVWTVPVEQMPA